ncbi:DNA-binding helix-turn-helix protein [Leptospira borgpetersenii serovar Pomona str. 200901868]|uniref:DNA-binding helix-turn-helix protein n=1 Tax=Leptospira borgpetersenii serovar Pomona str. 200901868 TaxID=1192866 RepID=M6W5S3_LEPBO|nr:DNA-binding helix-turn-helix protein [Leptospira borgpetersenii serovar Pomona str. 200901868]
MIRKISFYYRNNSWFRNLLHDSFRALFPSLFSKVTIPDINKDKEIELETIPEAKETKKYKYPSRDLLEGIDLEKVKTKLNHFLDSKGFIDEELRLPDFATDVGLTTHQASYYLNRYLNMSFTDFLQFHRINEVKNMIRINANFNLLNIALECGFNSASSFHRACIKFTGKSPRDLKKDIFLNESSSNTIPQKSKTQSDFFKDVDS